MLSVSGISFNSQVNQSPSKLPPFRYSNLNSQPDSVSFKRGEKVLQKCTIEGLKGVSERAIKTLSEFFKDVERMIFKPFVNGEGFILETPQNSTDLSPEIAKGLIAYQKAAREGASETFPFRVSDHGFTFSLVPKQ